MLSIFRPLVNRRVRWALAVAALGSCAVFAWRGPTGLPVLIERWDEVRRLEADQARLEEEIRAKKQRIQELEKKQSTFELEMRRELQMQRKDEKVLITGPDAEEPKTDKPAQP